MRLCGAFITLVFDVTSFLEKTSKMGHHVGVSHRGEHPGRPAEIAH
jgi:hypothetical protein